VSSEEEALALGLSIDDLGREMACAGGSLVMSETWPKAGGFE
jgi:hypothetical protein